MRADKGLPESLLRWLSLRSLKIRVLPFNEQIGQLIRSCKPLLTYQS